MKMHGPNDDFDPLEMTRSVLNKPQYLNLFGVLFGLVSTILSYKRFSSQAKHDESVRESISDLMHNLNKQHQDILTRHEASTKSLQLQSDNALAMSALGAGAGFGSVLGTLGLLSHFLEKNRNKHEAQDEHHTVRKSAKKRHDSDRHKSAVKASH